jgi:hypothetical protein
MWETMGEESESSNELFKFQDLKRVETHASNGRLTCRGLLEMSWESL